MMAALKVMFAIFKILTRAAQATANVRQDDIPSLRYCYTLPRKEGAGPEVTQCLAGGQGIRT